MRARTASTSSTNTEETVRYDGLADSCGNMDLIITACTSTAHLAGAIAAPTVALLERQPALGLAA